MPITTYVAQLQTSKNTVDSGKDNGKYREMGPLASNSDIPELPTHLIPLNKSTPITTVQVTFLYCLIKLEFGSFQ